MTPLEAGDGGGFLRIMRDTSQSKALEMRQRSELLDDRQAASELRSVSVSRDRFLAVMSHELKQPLNLIQVSAELLVRLPETRDSPTGQRIGDVIKRAVSSQVTLVNDLLDLSRVRTGKLRLYREQVDLGALVQRLVQAVAPELQRKSITLDVAVPETLCGDCDTVRTEQVVWNLLDNAAKFTPEHGRIELRLSVDGAMARLDVSDNGVGVAPQSLSSIFELFGQDEASAAPGQRRAGLGIGLALVRELVEAHGGRVEAASAGLGHGATFSVWLPLSRTTPAPEAEGRPPLASDARRRILVVDDEVDSLATLAAVLQLEGAAVDTAASGAQALQRLQDKRYDLLLSDIGMPEMSGIELMQRARELPSTQGMRAVAITGYGRDADVREALQAGFDAHVSKPVSIERLRAVLERL